MERKLAIISVFDKTGIVEFCQKISSFFLFISTGNTASHLRSAGIPVQEISTITKFPEILDGRVKTLHPHVLGGILGTTQHETELQQHEILPIGLVVTNLYPFQETVASPDHNLTEALEQIDIGGVTLLRAAAKNFQEVLVVCSLASYSKVANAVVNGTITPELRRELAKDAFEYTAKYDISISQYFQAFNKEIYPPNIFLQASNPQDLRYGENWHQDARYYLFEGKTPFFNSCMEKKYLSTT